MIKRSVSFCEEVEVYYIPSRKEVLLGPQEEWRLEEFVSAQDVDGSSLLLSIFSALLLLPAVYVLSMLVQEEQPGVNHYPHSSMFSDTKEALLRISQMIRSCSVSTIVPETGLDDALNQVPIH